MQQVIGGAGGGGGANGFSCGGGGEDDGNKGWKSLSADLLKASSLRVICRG